ncbi:MAG: RNB domain-containing ribonuclease, partial [Victivallales bacterium]|nr:RNB domain-containing ribonuclease [Victivallales bacterium]
PEKIVPMLPGGVTAVLGLGLAAESPALSFALRFDADGAPQLEKMAATRVRVTRLTYEEAEPQLASGPLQQINLLTESFRRRRLTAGAVPIVLPEVKIGVHDHCVDIRLLPYLASREMVADAMMAAGEAIAGFAREHDLPMTYAVQPPPDTAFTLPETMAGMFAARRMFKPSQVQVYPDRHFGLGLEHYVRATSPLRRYGDLLAHQQLRALLRGGTPRSADELTGRIAVAERAAGDLRRAERAANEYWKLVYLQQQPKWRGRAVAVDKNDDRVTLLIPELAYEYKSRLGSKTELNTTFDIALNTVDLPGLTARFRLV